MKYLLADRSRGKFDKIILIGHHRQCVSANWFGCLANQTMGKECCSRLSRRLWGASAIRSPLKTTAWEANNDTDVLHVPFIELFASNIWLVEVFIILLLFRERKNFIRFS